MEIAIETVVGMRCCDDVHCAEDGGWGVSCICTEVMSFQGERVGGIQIEKCIPGNERSHGVHGFCVLTWFH